MRARNTYIVRAPLTGIVLTVELTGEYDYMLPLLVCCFVAYGVAEAMNNAPIYEALRERAKRSAEAMRGNGSVIESPVEDSKPRS